MAPHEYFDPGIEGEERSKTKKNNFDSYFVHNVLGVIVWVGTLVLLTLLALTFMGVLDEPTAQETEQACAQACDERGMPTYDIDQDGDCWCSAGLTTRRLKR